MIPFNKVPYVPSALEYVKRTIENGRLAGDGEYTKLCSRWMENRFDANKVLLTTSCTSALEMAAMLIDIRAGDEVIMPSYTFVSTANAFAIRGAKCVFVDIRPDTMNIDETLIEDAITEKTKAIVVVHYAGVACEMDAIVALANKYDISIIEDAAQGVIADYKGKFLGTFGDFGCYSFHETKNYVMGEGGALVINSEKYVERAEIIREKGTNRAQFFRGEIDRYSWVDIGSSFLPSELNAAYLYGQLEAADEINQDRLSSWQQYYNGLVGFAEKAGIELPMIPEGCNHNGHLFYLKLKSLSQRTEFINYMKEHEIYCAFHYVPLHSSECGKRHGRFSGIDRYTTKESERLVRLPMYYQLDHQDFIIDTIRKWKEIRKA